MRLPPLLLLLLLALPLPSPRSASAQITSQLVNGLGELGEPATVGLVQVPTPGAPPEDGFLVCSGVIVGCDTVITTAHCFNTNVALKTHIYVPHAGFIEIESATRHPAYVDALVNKPEGWIDTTREDDISFVKLAETVGAVTPATINTSAPPPPGTNGTVVGFGRDPVSESGTQNPGIKRSGGMQLAACTEPSLVGLDLLCWSPSDPLPPPGEEVSTCSGDSGGPLFTWVGGARVVSGITKGAVFDPQGQPDPCLPPVSPYDVNLHRHREWIAGSDGSGGMVATSQAVPLFVKQCQATAQLPEVLSAPGPCDPSGWGAREEARTCGFQGTLGSGGQARYSFVVPPGTARLRVALNGIAASSGGVDTDLYLAEGQPAETWANECVADGAGTLGVCEIAAPAAGTWHVLVDQPLGSGEHQMVATLTSSAPVPGLGRPLAALTLVLLAASAALRAPLGGSRRRQGSA